MPKKKNPDEPNRIRINVQLDSEVLRQVDEYAKFNGLTRAGAVSVLCMQTIQQSKALDMMKGFEDNMKKLLALKSEQDGGSPAR